MREGFGLITCTNNAELNTGVLLLRPTKATLALVERWTASQLAAAERHEMNDQSHFNAVVNARGRRRRSDRRRRLFKRFGPRAVSGRARARLAAALLRNRQFGFERHV